MMAIKKDYEHSLEQSVRFFINQVSQREKIPLDHFRLSLQTNDFVLRLKEESYEVDDTQKLWLA